MRNLPPVTLTAHWCAQCGKFWNPGRYVSPNFHTSEQAPYDRCYMQPVTVTYQAEQVEVLRTGP